MITTQILFFFKSFYCSLTVSSISRFIATTVVYRVFLFYLDPVTQGIKLLFKHSTLAFFTSWTPDEKKEGQARIYQER